MKQYLDLLSDIMENGYQTGDRTGTGTRSVFARQLRFNLTKGFPLITTKKVFWRGVVEELLWIISGSTNVKPLQEKGIRIWDQWADENGDLGPVYGSQWRAWPAPRKEEFFDNKGNTWFEYKEAYIDQLAAVIDRIKSKPTDRRLVVSAWNPADVDKMALPPCHCFFQFKVYGDKLSCQLYQRSADVFLGVPFNIASYALLTHMVAHVTGLHAYEFTHTFGDVHIYNNHVDQVKEQLKRDPLPLPSLSFSDEGMAVKNIDDFKANHILLEGYNSHAAIKAEVSV